MNNHTCPACGYELWFEPWSGGSPGHEICPCRGIQFGYDDFTPKRVGERQAVYEDWRAAWIAEGMRWRSPSPPPAGWNSEAQLRRLTGGSDADRNGRKLAGHLNA